MMMKWIVCLALFCVLIDGAYGAPKVKQTTVKICVNQATGAIQGRTRCSRNETALTLSLIKSAVDDGQEPSHAEGLHVYDANGKVIGPADDLGGSSITTFIQIAGLHYLIGVGVDHIGFGTNVYWSSPGCVGTPYHKAKDLTYVFPSLHRLIVSLPNKTIYTPNLSSLGTYAYASVTSILNGELLPCHDALGTVEGYELTAQGELEAMFPPPYDVH